MKRPKGDMDFTLFKKVIDNIDYVSRISITGLGETLLNSDLISMIKYAKSKGKTVQIITNATLLNDVLIEELVYSGLTIITFSLDGVDEVYEKVRGWSYRDVENKISKFIEFNNKAGHPIRVEINGVEFDETKDGMNTAIERWRDKVDLFTITPEMRTSTKRTKPCLYLWRSLYMFWDGRVGACCLDWEADLTLGHISRNTVRDIFNGMEMVELRKRHLNKDFPFPCSVCNEFYA